MHIYIERFLSIAAEFNGLRHNQRIAFLWAGNTQSWAGVAFDLMKIIEANESM